MKPIPNDIHFEPFKRGCGDLLDALGPTVQARRARPLIAATQVEPELGGDHQLLAKGRKGLADEFFVCVWAVNFSGIKERDTSIHGGTEKSSHLLFVFGWAVGKAHSHAAESDGRDFQITFPEFALLT